MRRAWSALVAAALLAAIGCDDAPREDDAGAGAAADDAADLPGHVLDIVADEYAFHAPDSVPAGVVTLRLTQHGDATLPWPGDTARRRQDPTYDLHMVWLVRLDSARTVSDLVQSEIDRQPTPPWATLVGGVGFAHPPGAANSTLHLEPGSYAIVCFVGSAREDRTRYHLLKGMVRPLTVTRASSAAEAMPATDVVVDLAGDSIGVSDTLAAGTHRLLVRNARARPADFAIRRLNPGVSIDSANAWRPLFLTEPPFTVLGGVVAVPVNGSLITTIAFEPGEYAFGRRLVVVE